MSEFIEYETPSCCLRRLTQQDKSGKFKLKIKSDQKENNFIEITTTINKIRVISKKINSIFEFDPTLDEYEIHFPPEISGSKDIKTHLENLLKSTEEKVTILKEQEKQMNMIRLFLGETTNEDEVCIEMNNIKEAISYLSTEAHSSSIQFLSSHLKEIIEEGEFDKLDEQIAFEIIDSFFQQTKSKSKSKNEEENKNKNEKENENCNEEIFEQIKQKENVEIVMHFLLQVDLEDFTEDMKKYIANNLSDEIVDNEFSQIIIMFRNLILNSKSSKSNKLQNEINIEYENDELNGIISYMKKTINENLIETGELKLSSGHQAHSGSLTNLIKYDKDHIDNYFRNNDGSRLKESEGWIEFDFGHRKVNLTSYTLRTSCYGINGTYHPKTWRVLGSKDGKEWDVLNKQTNNSILNDSRKQHRFECNNNNNYYRFIRYIQDDSWCQEREYCIWLSCIEFFGSISL